MTATWPVVGTPNWSPGLKAYVDYGDAIGVGRYKTWSDLPEPFIIPHRGAGPYVAPDNTMEAFRIGLTMDFGVIDGGDIRVLTDGTFASMHDNDMRLTPLNGQGVHENDLNGPGWSLLKVDSSRWFGGNWPDCQAVRGEQLWNELGDKTLMTPEWKTDFGDPLGYQAMVQYLVRVGFSQRVLFNSFSTTACTYAIANGIPNVCWNLPIPVIAGDVASNLATLAGMTGVRYVGMSGVPADSVITSYISAGYKVLLGPISRQTSLIQPSGKAHYDSLGVSGYYLDDPFYEAAMFSKYRVTVAPWTRSGTFYYGHKFTQASAGFDVPLRGSFTGSTGYWRWQPVTGQDSYWLQGWGSPVANAATTYRLTVPVVFDAVGSNNTRHADIIFGAVRDEPQDNTTNTNFTGYLVLHRVNGQMSLYKWVAGAASLITSVTCTAIQNVTLSSGLTAGAAITTLPVNALSAAIVAGAQWSLPNGQIVTASAGAAISATSISINSVTPAVAVSSGATLGQQITIAIDVTPTTVTATRTDLSTSNVVSSVDATYRGGYFYFGHLGSTDGLRVSYGAATVT